MPACPSLMCSKGQTVQTFVFDVCVCRFGFDVCVCRFCFDICVGAGFVD